MLLGLGATWLPGLSMPELSSPVSQSSDQKCNPHLLTSFGNDSVLAGAESYETQWWDAPSIVGLVIFILCTLFIRCAWGQEREGFFSGEGT